METSPPPPPSSPVEAQVVAPDPSRSAQQPVIVVQTDRRGWTRWLSWLGWVGFLVCLPILVGMSVAYHDYFDTTHGIRERFHSGAEHGRDKIAIIEVSGIIRDGDGYVKHQIDRVRNDSQVRGVVVRIDSPGGTITGSDYIYHHLRRLREERKLPMVVSMGSVAASGGYYIAMAVGDRPDSIFAEPTTTTGSIGVIIPHYDLSGLLERLDIKDDSLASHPRKQLLSMTQPMSDDDRQVVKRYLDQAFDRFKEIVKSGRPELRDDPDTLEKVSTGEFFSAATAVEIGLVDQVGFIEDAIKRVAELAGVELDSTRVVRYDPPPSLLDAFGRVHSSYSDPLTRMWESATPRAYYLWTLRPPLLSSPP